MIRHVYDLVPAVESNAGSDGYDDHHVVCVAEQFSALVQDVADGIVLRSTVVDEPWLDDETLVNAGLGKHVSGSDGGGAQGLPDGHVCVKVGAGDTPCLVGAHEGGLVGADFDMC